MFIGKKGRNLKKIEKDTKVIMQIEKDEKEGVRVRLTGLPLAVEAARIEIHELLLQILRRSFCHSTKIPNQLVGPLIGKNGKNIEAIRNISGVKIDIGCNGDDGFTQLHIYGDYWNIVLAVNMMKERFDNFKSNLSVYERPDRKEFFEQLRDSLDDS
ncbi:hypothetical protein RB195_007818 [Necator americanus]